jgi:hypothetical protein
MIFLYKLELDLVLGEVFNCQIDTLAAATLLLQNGHVSDEKFIL